MKKLVLTSILALAIASSVQAADQKTKKFTRNYGMAGCGLGSMAIDKSGNQVFAATTNETSGSQTFGITSGTSNCDSSAAAEVADRMDRFVVANEVALASDIARGNGETLASLAALMNCSDSAQVGAALQSNFKQIFPNYGVTPNEVTDSIITTVRMNDSLAASCKSVI